MCFHVSDVVACAQALENGIKTGDVIQTLSQFKSFIGSCNGTQAVHQHVQLICTWASSDAFAAACQVDPRPALICHQAHSKHTGFRDQGMDTCCNDLLQDGCTHPVLSPAHQLAAAMGKMSRRLITYVILDTNMCARSLDFCLQWRQKHPQCQEQCYRHGI